MPYECHHQRLPYPPAILKNSVGIGQQVVRGLHQLGHAFPIHVLVNLEERSLVYIVVDQHLFSDRLRTLMMLTELLHLA